MSDRNDNNWNSSNASTESVGNRKTSQNKSLPANKCEDQMQRTDCDIQKDQLISGTTAADTTDTTAADNSQTNEDNEANDKQLVTDEPTDASPPDMQSQHRDDQSSNASHDDSHSTGKRAQNKNKNIVMSNETKSKNDSSANDNSNPKGMNDKKAQEESDARTDEYKCPVCDLKLDSQHTFTIHIRQHNPSDHSHTCRLCNKTLSSASSLDRHMLIHSGERPFKCRICSMAFTTNGNMHRHMRTHGVDNNNDDANGTDSHTHSSRLIKSKKRKVSEGDHKEEKTPQKKRDSEVNGLPTKQSEVVGTVEISCPICKKTMASKSALHTHMEVHPNDSICCLDCGMIVNNYATYTQHRCTAAALDGTTQSTSLNRMNFSGAPAVGFYDLSFTDFSSRKFSLIAKSFCEHNLRKASSPYHDFECDKCKRAFPCGSALNLHQSTHEGQTYCQVCRLDFPTPALYMSHQMKHRLDYPMPMTGTIPKALDFRMDSSDVHKTSYGDVPHSDKEDFLALLDLQNKGSQLNGVHLNYKFTRTEEPFENSSYYIHAQPIPPRPTTFPPKSTANGNETESNKHDLADIQSILSVTSSANPLMSGIRSSPPAASPASPVHLGTSGPKPDSPVAADSANASPNTPSVNSCKTENDEKLNDSIESHEKSLSIVTEAEDESTPSFQCNKCPLKFKSQNALKRHNRGHTSGGHSYACHLCSYTSLDKSTLVRHLRTHNGERPFQCAICKYAFTTKANCERHVKKRHKKIQKQEIRSAMQYNPNMSTTSSLTQQNLTKTETNLSLSPNSDSFPGGFDTVCKYCNVDFKFNRVLRHHLRSLHNSCSRKPFCCTVCKLGFSTKNNCIRHVVKQHPDMKDRLSSVVLANASVVGLSSDHSESESIYQDSTKDSLHLSTDNSMNGFSTTPSMTGAQPNSSLAALCQIAKNISANSEKPMNLAIDNKYNDEDEDTECSGCDDQPLNLASHSSEEQPLDLAVHALDLSCKPSQGSKEKGTEDMKQVNEAVRTAASSLLALRSMTTPNVFSQNSLLPNNLQPTLFHPAIPLTPPLPAHSSSSMSMLSPTPSSSMDDIYKVTTFRISKNRLLPRNERSFTCIYCSAGFTLKSNMERHIKRKHPEFARPPRSRGMSTAANPSHSSAASAANLANTSLLSKCNNPTLSSKTRAALRVVLNNKVMGSSSGPNSRPSSPMDSSATNLSTKATEDNNNNNSSCDQNGDLASVSSLIDHSTNSSNALKQYFNKQNEEMDSNGAQSSGNASNSDTNTEPIRPNSLKSENSSGKSAKEENDQALNGSAVTKKRSAYTDSPNSVSCPYCARKFPWTSSLRRHILTHTGLKPYKCPKCPILFTTKSNCERHLIRKHNGREKRSVEQTMIGADSKPYKCNVCPNSTFTTQGNLRKHYYLRHWTKTGKTNGLKSRAKDSKVEEEVNHIDQTDVNEEEDEEEGTDRLNFKCYVCEAPFTGRLKCLKHIQSCHSNEYATLQSKGAVDKVPSTQTRLMLDNHNDEYDAYGPEKISCVFCPRHFTLFDNLRRHMRVHLGERPFRCALCPKKFSLKNSLLRHHRTNHPESVLSGRTKGKPKQTTIPSISSASTLAKESENSVASKPIKSKSNCNSLLYLIPNEGVKESEKFTQNDDFSDADNGQGSDLIQNLLGLQDSKILDDLLDSGADSAARILGVKDLA